jgi:hypothetical protein
MARHRKEYAGERYSEHFSFQLTPRQRHNLENAADASGQVIAEFVRSYLPLGAAAPRGVCKRCQWASADLALAVARLGVNLNQLTRRANTEGRLPEAAELRALLAKVKELLKRIALEMDTEMDTDNGAED